MINKNHGSDNNGFYNTNDNNFFNCSKYFFSIKSICFLKFFLTLKIYRNEMSDFDFLNFF